MSKLRIIQLFNASVACELIFFIAVAVGCGGGSGGRSGGATGGTDGVSPDEVVKDAAPPADAPQGLDVGAQDTMVVGGTGGTGDTGGTEGSGTVDCPGNGGPSMVKLPQGYCIDSTEVTRSQYSAWLATSPAAPPSSDANCGWKSTASYAADATCMAGTYQVCQGSACGNHPQVCVDWCDAFAYCAGVGKRLCGRIGGGPNLYADYANASLSQWHNACTSAGANTNYPYGGAYQPSACNGVDLGKKATTVVGSLTGCQAPAPYAGVYDLSGNVWEWEDSCSDAGQLAFCRLRGGAFFVISSSLYLTCDSGNLGGGAVRDDVSPLFGFRCCAP